MSEDRIKEFSGEYLRRFAYGVEELLGLCESPIERLFLAAALGQHAASHESVPADLREVVGSDAIQWWAPDATLAAHFEGAPDDTQTRASVRLLPHVLFVDDSPTFLVPQFKLETAGRSMRIDLALFPWSGSPCSPVAIELDGHDFHERTKEQAAKDKSRDRDLQAAGWRVLRFTGSEVWRDPKRCVREMHLVMLWESVRREPGAAQGIRNRLATFAPRALR